MTRQVALVTGSSRGIGLAVARALAARGFAIALNAREDSPELKSAEQAIEQIGVPSFRTVLDIADVKHFDAALDEIENALGPLTTLVNNAGISVLSRGDILDVSEESFDRCIAVNTKGLFFMNQRFAKRLVERERSDDLFYSIINITSSNAQAVAVPRSEYAVSKAGAAMASKSFAVRLGGEGIYVYDVQPGLIETDMTSSVIGEYDKRAKNGLTVIPRIGQSSEIGTVVCGLATGALPYVTGQVISADGGLLIPRF